MPATVRPSSRHGHFGQFCPFYTVGRQCDTSSSGVVRLSCHRVPRLLGPVGTRSGPRLDSLGPVGQTGQSGLVGEDQGGLTLLLRCFMYFWLFLPFWLFWPYRSYW